MKFFAALCFIVIIYSCRNSSENNVISNAPIRKDSVIKQQEQSNSYAPVDISPMDISYFPPDYPVLKMTNKISSLPVARVIYSRPHKQGRTIFGELLKYGEPWRLGANEATEIEFFQPVTIQNKRIDKGRYILYSIPEEQNWTIIFNSNIFSWGLTPDPKNDLHRVQVPVNKTQNSIEFFTMVFEKTDTGADLLFAWDDVEARMPIVVQ